MGDGDVELRVCARGHPEQLQGAAPDHEDGGGGEAVQAALRSSWWVAQTKYLLDDPGESTLEVGVAREINSKDSRIDEWPLKFFDKKRCSLLSILRS